MSAMLRADSTTRTPGGSASGHSPSGRQLPIASSSPSTTDHELAAPRGLELEQVGPAGAAGRRRRRAQVAAEPVDRHQLPAEPAQHVAGAQRAVDPRGDEVDRDRPALLGQPPAPVGEQRRLPVARRAGDQHVGAPGGGGEAVEPGELVGAPGEAAVEREQQLEVPARAAAAAAARPPAPGRCRSGRRARRARRRRPAPGSSPAARATSRRAGRAAARRPAPHPGCAEAARRRGAPSTS